MRALIIGLISCVMSLNAFAKVDSDLIKKAETYLNNVSGLSGDFKQSSSNGQKDSGKFALYRPGKLKLDYKKSPIQLISDGTDLYYHDIDLDQITTIPINSTPAGIFIRENVDLRNDDVKVLETKSDNSKYSLKMIIKENPGLGTMIVYFDKDSDKLLGWSVVDATGLTTEIALSNLKPKNDFDKNFFNLKYQKTFTGDNQDSFYN